MKPLLVTCYVNPDLDGVASAVAYAEFLNSQGREAQAGILGKPHDEARYVLTRFRLPSPEEIADDKDYQEVILVDASDLNGLESRINQEKVIEIIDHRKVHDAGKFSRAKAQIELVGAAATLITEKFLAAGSQISKESALLLYSAIISNTLNFKGSVTTERDRQASAWLAQFIQVPPDYWRELFLAKSDLAGSKLEERIRGDFAWFTLGAKRVGIAQLEIIGAEDLIRQRGEEIIAALEELKADLNLDYVFQNTIELDKLRNFIIAGDKDCQELLTRVLGIEFSGCVARKDQLMMRKQIVPLIKDELERLVN